MLFRSVRDFDDLAQRGPATLGSHGLKQNHVATVYIDGNSVGQHIERASSSDRIGLSSRLKEATTAALNAATEAVHERLPTGPLAVIPHVVGGDDVLVSVPAFMWRPFVATFLKVFGTSADPVSASAGIVIAHLAYPFNRAVEVADDLLSKAKAAVDGKQSSLAVIELTSEAAQPTRARVWTETDLARLSASIKILSDTGKSARHELARAAAAPERLVARNLLRRQCARMGIGLDAELTADPALVADLLDLVKWWWPT